MTDGMTDCRNLADEFRVCDGIFTLLDCPKWGRCATYIINIQLYCLSTSITTLFLFAVNKVTHWIVRGRPLIIWGAWCRIT